MNIKNLQVPLNSSSFNLSTGACRVLNISFRETTGINGATFYLLDGSAPGSDVVSLISLAPGESIRDYFGEHGLRFESGIYFQLIGGSVRGNVQSVLEEEFLTYMDEMKAIVNIASAGQ